jgi:hypothetical protein
MSNIYKQQAELAAEKEAMDNSGDLEKLLLLTLAKIVEDENEAANEPEEKH